MSAPASEAAATADEANGNRAVNEMPPYDAVLHTPFTCLYLSYAASLTTNLSQLLLRPPQHFIAEPQGPPSFHSPQRFHPNPGNAAAEDAASAEEAQRAEAEAAHVAAANAAAAAPFHNYFADARRRPLTRDANLTRAGLCNYRFPDGEFRFGHLVRCNADLVPGTLYRYVQIVGDMSPGLRQCGAELRAWQRAGSISPHIVQCRYAASERRDPLQLHWFLLDLPGPRLLEYLSLPTTRHNALTVIRMLYGVAHALQELTKLNFIIGPRALTINNLWVQGATDATEPPRLLLENGLCYLADAGNLVRDVITNGLVDVFVNGHEWLGGGSGQWNFNTRFNVLHDLRNNNELLKVEDMFTYMQVAYVEETMAEDWRTLARRALTSCMRQFAFLAYDLYMCSDSGLDGAAGYVSSSDDWDEELNDLIQFVNIRAVEQGDLKYVATFMEHCRQAALDTRPEHGGVLGCPGVEGCFVGCCKLLKMLLETGERTNFCNVIA